MPSDAGTVLADFDVAGEPHHVRDVVRRVGALCAGLGLPRARLDALATAVAEATLNAIEHGNAGDASLTVGVRLEVCDDTVVVRVTDEGHGGGPPQLAEEPDVDAKLRGEQAPRGWGLFLMRSSVDEVRLGRDDDGRGRVELVVRLEGHGVRSASGRSRRRQPGRPGR